MGEPQNMEANVSTAASARIDVHLGKKIYRVAYVQAFALACSLLERGQFEEAGALFERLKQFTEQGPKAFIMRAFCHAAALHFGECSKPLAEFFSGEKQLIVAELHNAFVSYHVGIRQDALKTMVELVNKYPDLPTLCLLLGDMFARAGDSDMARKCWSMAVRRDRKKGAVAAVAAKQLKRLSS